MMALPPSGSIVLVLLLAVGAGGYWAGDHNRNNAWLARATEQSRAAAKLWRDEVARSGAAAQQAAQQQQALQNSYATLESKFNELTLRGPIVVFRDRRGGIDAAGAPGGPVAVGGSVQAAALPTGDGLADAAVGLSLGAVQAAALPTGAGLADAAVGLSLGAVWMWNSALFAADTAAGACSAADTASAACAVDSGLGLADAWANHAANARACATDRLRQQQLIDYLANQPKPAP